jgi:hypothetical protein
MRDWGHALLHATHHAVHVHHGDTGDQPNAAASASASDAASELQARLRKQGTRALTRAVRQLRALLPPGADSGATHTHQDRHATACGSAGSLHAGSPTEDILQSVACLEQLIASLQASAPQQDAPTSGSTSGSFVSRLWGKLGPKAWHGGARDSNANNGAARTLSTSVVPPAVHATAERASQAAQSTGDQLALRARRASTAVQDTARRAADAAAQEASDAAHAAQGVAERAGQRAAHTVERAGDGLRHAAASMAGGVARGAHAAVAGAEHAAAKGLDASGAALDAGADALHSAADASFSTADKLDGAAASHHHHADAAAAGSDPSVLAKAHDAFAARLDEVKRVLAGIRRLPSAAAAHSLHLPGTHQHSSQQDRAHDAAATPQEEVQRLQIEHITSLRQRLQDLEVRLGEHVCGVCAHWGHQTACACVPMRSRF